MSNYPQSSSSNNNTFPRTIQQQPPQFSSTNLRGGVGQGNSNNTSPQYHNDHINSNNSHFHRRQQQPQPAGNLQYRLNPEQLHSFQSTPSARSNMVSPQQQQNHNNNRNEPASPTEYQRQLQQRQASNQISARDEDYSPNNQQQQQHHSNQRQQQQQLQPYNGSNNGVVSGQQQSPRNQYHSPLQQLQRSQPPPPPQRQRQQPQPNLDESHSAYVPAIVIHGGASAAAASLHDYRVALHEVLLIGQQMLKNGRECTDIVAECCRLLEEIPIFNAGVGSVFNCEGEHELDASMMRGSDLAAGSVTAVKTIRNPILVCKKMIEKNGSVMLTGAGAEQYAKSSRASEIVENSFFSTMSRRAQYEHTQNLSIKVASSESPDRSVLVQQQQQQEQQQQQQPVQQQQQQIQQQYNNPEPTTANSHLPSPIRREETSDRFVNQNPSSFENNNNNNNNGQYSRQHQHNIKPSAIAEEHQDLHHRNQHQPQLQQYNPENNNNNYNNNNNFPTGTVGVACLDIRGNLAAGTSSGGLTNKPRGRVADTGIIGSGTYAHNDFAAVSCCGSGEILIRSAAGFNVVARMRFGSQPFFSACDQVIFEDVAGLGGVGGLVAIDPSGNVAMPFSSTAMPRGFVQISGEPRVAVLREPLKTLEELHEINDVKLIVPVVSSSTTTITPSHNQNQPMTTPRGGGGMMTHNNQENNVSQHVQRVF